MTFFYRQLEDSSGRDELDYAIGAIVLWYHAFRVECGFKVLLPERLGPYCVKTNPSRRRCIRHVVSNSRFSERVRGYSMITALALLL